MSTMSKKAVSKPSPRAQVRLLKQQLAAAERLINVYKFHLDRSRRQRDALRAR